MSRTRNDRPSSEQRRVRRAPSGSRDTVLANPAGMRLFSRARTLEDRGELERALEVYEHAARCESIVADSLQACARIQRELGMLHESITALTNALHHCEDDRLLSFELYVELGDIHAQLGDFGEATYYYRRAERYDSRDISLQRRLRSASTLATSQAVVIEMDAGRTEAVTAYDMPEPGHPEYDDLSVQWELEDWELATG